MVDVLVVIYDRLLRAKDHFELIEADLLTYYGSDFGQLRGVYDPGGNGVPAHWSLVGRQALPEGRFHTLVGEFLHNVRSSLDHLAWKLVEANGGTPQDRETSFPILKPRPGANGQWIHPAPHVAGGVSQSAMRLIDDAQPYTYEANYMVHPLFVLNELWNIDKHRHVAMNGAQIRGFPIESGTPRFAFHLETVSFDKHGANVAFVPDDPNVHVDLKTIIRVMVHEPSPGIQMALREALAEGLQTVSDLVSECEDSCF